MELPAARRLFALDHGFPQPIVAVLADFTPDVELVPIDEINERLPDLDDWEVLLALHHHHRPWDGLVTTDAGMVQTPESLAVLLQTKGSTPACRSTAAWRRHSRRSRIRTARRLGTSTT